MIILFLISIIVFLLITKEILNIPIKYFIPMLFLMLSMSYVFTQLSKETEFLILENTPIPFGSFSIQEQVIHIEEVNQLHSIDPIFTLITYNFSNLSNNSYKIPTKEINITDKLKLTFKLSNNYKGNYKIFLPSINTLNVFRVIDFETSDKNFYIDNNLFMKNCSEILINNNYKNPLDNEVVFSVTIGLDQEIIKFNNMDENNNKFYYDDDFKISFQNSINENERIKIIVYE